MSLGFHASGVYWFLISGTFMLLFIGSMVKENVVVKGIAK
jgi:hypothetical protein